MLPWSALSMKSPPLSTWVRPACGKPVANVAKRTSPELPRWHESATDGQPGAQRASRRKRRTRCALISERLTKSHKSFPESQIMLFLE